MTPQDLYDVVCEALEVTGVPSWPTPETDGDRDVLVLLDDADEGVPETWALLTVPAGQAEDMEPCVVIRGEAIEYSRNGDVSSASLDDCVLVDVAFAETLLARHFAAWLLERGWQVQATLVHGCCRWRLCDCISFTDGGGDRLDADYPYGTEELDVLSESVVVTSQFTHVRAPLAVAVG